MALSVSNAPGDAKQVALVEASESYYDEERRMWHFRLLQRSSEFASPITSTIQIHANTFLAEEEAERWAQRVAEHAEVNQFCSNQVYGADQDWRRKLLQLQEL